MPGFLTSARRVTWADDRWGEDLFCVPPALQASQIAEVRRRILQIENGEVSPVPGEEAMPRVRGLAEAVRAPGAMTYGFHPEALLEYADATNIYACAAGHPRDGT